METSISDSCSHVKGNLHTTQASRNTRSWHHGYTPLWVSTHTIFSSNFSCWFLISFFIFCLFCFFYDSQTLQYSEWDIWHFLPQIAQIKGLWKMKAAPPKQFDERLREWKWVNILTLAIKRFQTEYPKRVWFGERWFRHWVALGRNIPFLHPDSRWIGWI